MGTTPAGLLIASYRGGSTYAPLYETFVIVPLLVAMGLGCVLIFTYLRRRSRRPPPVSNQWQALSAMGELCPHGWSAQITLSGETRRAPRRLRPPPCHWSSWSGLSSPRRRARW